MSRFMFSRRVYNERIMRRDKRAIKVIEQVCNYDNAAV